MKSIFTKEVKIALAAICAIILLFYGINFLKGSNPFKKHNMYYVNFHDVTGLQVSNPVYTNGFTVGIVRDIDYDYDHPGNIRVGIEVNENMRFTEGSHAELASSMLGNTTMNVILGTSSKFLRPGDSFPGGPEEGLMSRAADLIPTIQQMLPKFDSILANLNVILSDPKIKQTLDNTEYVTANLKQTTDDLNVLMHNDVPALLAKLESVGSNTEQLTGKLKDLDYATTLAKVNETVAQVNAMTKDLNEKLNSREGSLGLMLNDKTLYTNLNKTIESSNALMTDLKAHPKRYVHFSVFGKKDK